MFVVVIAVYQGWDVFFWGGNENNYGSKLKKYRVAAWFFSRKGEMNIVVEVKLTLSYRQSQNLKL